MFKSGKGLEFFCWANRNLWRFKQSRMNEYILKLVHFLKLYGFVSWVQEKILLFFFALRHSWWFDWLIIVFVDLRCLEMRLGRELMVEFIKVWIWKMETLLQLNKFLWRILLRRISTSLWYIFTSWLIVYEKRKR